MTSRWPWVAALVGGLALAALPARAQFGASDLLYVPAVAHNEGADGSVWRTDLAITNVDTVPIDVVMLYLPSGVQSNAYLFSDRSLWLGGRESYGVGFLNEALADIPPNGTVLLPDVVGEYWQGQLGLSGLGAMVVFAQEAGSLQDDGSRVYRNAVVLARISNQTTTYEPDPDNEGQFIEVPVNYGQDMPGVPWYDLADPAAVSDQGDFSYQVLTGAIENSSFRYNVGLLNASDIQTTITVSVQPFQPDGEPFLDDQGNPLSVTLQLPALAHTQYNRILAALGITQTQPVMLRVGFVAWSTTSPEPHPALTSYGSLITTGSNDPTTVLPSFAFPFNTSCMFPDTSGTAGGSKAAPVGGGQLSVRPLRVAPKVSARAN